MLVKKSVAQYCAKMRIEINDEGFDCFEFIAPAGSVFANESKYRIIEELSYITAATAIDCLSLSIKL